MSQSASPIPDPREGQLKEPPPSDLSDYTWDDSETEHYTPGSADSALLGARGAAARNPAQDVGRFQELAVEVGLIGEAELTAIRARLFPDGQHEDVRRLCTELVRIHKMTPYQTAAIRQGKSRGLVIGDYHVLDKIGSGGMGLVLRARDRRSGQVVALKLLPPSISRDRAAVIRFRREAAAVARLRHPNIVAALGSGETHGLLFLVMELVEGRDLSRFVKHQGTLGVDRAVDCLIQAARGLQEAHRHGIIHRDIKPANLLLDRTGTVKVLDLGLARISEGRDLLTAESSDLNLTASGAFVGTVDYMSPEQAFDPRLADARSDVYSLGCAFHYMLTGKAPYGGQSFMERLLGHRERPIPSLLAARGDVSEAVDALFRRMLAKSPEARPQTMQDVIEDALETRKSAARGPSRPAAPAARAAPVSGVDWRDEGDDSDSIYDVLPDEQAPPRRLADASATVFVRSRSSSSDRIEGPRARRARRRRHLVAGLLFFAAVVAGWYFGIRSGWLRLR